MGLILSVGLLASTRRYSPERLNYADDQLAAINEVLQEQGLPEYQEPEDLEVWSVDLWGQSGLQTLRRVAAHLWACQGVPEPARRGIAGVPEASSDPMLNAYYDEVQRWLRQGAPRYRMAYEHLILHSDDRGYYLPLRFPQVIFTHPGLGIAGTMLGSAPVLVDECRQLLGALQAPPDLDQDSEELREAVSNPGRGEGWHRCGIEVEACVKLLAVCQRALESNAMVVFTSS
jgi:hypothetical protein